MYGKSQKIASETDIGSKSQDDREHQSDQRVRARASPRQMISRWRSWNHLQKRHRPSRVPTTRSCMYHPPSKLINELEFFVFLSWKKRRALVIPIKTPNPQETIASLVRIPNYRTVASYFKRSKKKRKHIPSGSKRTFGILWCQITPSSRVFSKIKVKKEKTIHN